MTYTLRITPAAQGDLERLFRFLAEKDLEAALAARAAIGKAYELLETQPFCCRKAEENNPFIRELLIGFGHSGYVALFEIEDSSTVTILAIRHQLEEDYH